MPSNSVRLFVLVAVGLSQALAKTCTKELRFTYMTWKMDTFTQQLKPMPQAVRKISVVCCPGYHQVGRRGMTPFCEAPACHLNCVQGYCDSNNRCVCYEGYKLSENGRCELEEAERTTSTSTVPPTTTTTTMRPTTTTTTTTMRPTTTTTTTTTTMRPTTTTTMRPTTTTTTTEMPATRPTTTTTSTTTTTTTMPTMTTTTTALPVTRPPTTTTTMRPTTTSTTTTTPATTTTTTPATTTTTTPASTTTTMRPTTTPSTTTPTTTTRLITETPSRIPSEEMPLTRRIFRTQELQPRASLPYKTIEHKPMTVEPEIQTAHEAGHMMDLECKGSVNCACPAGYTLDSQSFKCRPLCNGKIYGCIGGTCIGINQCRCDEGTHLAAGELFHCQAAHASWKWALPLLLIPAALVVGSLYVAMRRWRTAKANRLNAQGESFAEVRLNRSSDHDDDEVSLGECSSGPSVHLSSIKRKC